MTPVCERRLYWLEYTRGHLYRYDPASGSHETIYEGQRVAGFTFQVDGSLLLLMDGPGVAIWRGLSTSRVNALLSSHNRSASDLPGIQCVVEPIA